MTKGIKPALFSQFIIIEIEAKAAANDTVVTIAIAIIIKISILIIGFISSFLTGVLACKLMLKIVANNNLIYFSFYCFVLGIISIFII